MYSRKSKITDLPFGNILIPFLQKIFATPTLIT